MTTEDNMPVSIIMTPNHGNVSITKSSLIITSTSRERLYELKIN